MAFYNHIMAVQNAKFVFCCWHFKTPKSLNEYNYLDVRKCSSTIKRNAAAHKEMEEKRVHGGQVVITMH